MKAQQHAALGGPLFTRYTVPLALLGLLGLAAIAWRFAVGLGPTTGLNDGYPWGIWIAYDVVTGTALACGGYALAILVYVFNKGRYHRLVRPAMLTAALGYSLAGVSVMFDVGRPWAAWQLALPWKWNTSSVLLEVALCILSYTAILWIEMAPVVLERIEDGRFPWWARAAKWTSGALERVLPFVLAFGLLLPTMHQSSLGSLMIIAQTKLHPLWHTPLLPVLFLVSVVGMGYAAIIIESVVAALTAHRMPERAMLGKLSSLIPPIIGGFIVLRVGDLALRGRLGLVFDTWLGWFFAGELVLFALPVVMLASKARRGRMLWQFTAAWMLLLGGILYRFDVFLVAYNPGKHWHYFPSLPELTMTLGIIALEAFFYTVFVKRFPIYTARVLQPARGAA